jgi:hypothetical protein
VRTAVEVLQYMIYPVLRVDCLIRNCQSHKKLLALMGGQGLGTMREIEDQSESYVLDHQHYRGLGRYNLVE